jgi:flagellar motility protein MotE (MotC chaperone)
MRREFKKRMELPFFFILFYLGHTNTQALEPAPTEQTQKAEETPPKVKKKRKEPSKKCLDSEEAIQDLQQLKQELSLKEKTLNEKAIELSTQEKHLQEELDKIEKARKQLLSEFEQKKENNNKRISKIAETLLAMSAKSAAQLLASFSDKDALQIMALLDATKLGKIMNSMNPQRSKVLSEKFIQNTDEKEVTQ